MAEAGNAQADDAASITPPHTSHGAGTAAEDPPLEDILAGLSDSNRNFLSQVAGILEDYGPQLDVLGDVPQLSVQPADALKVCRKMKETPGILMSQLLCLACVDYSDHLQVLYILHSLEPERTLAIKTDVSYDSPNIPSVSSVWRAADWYEREAHDLFGVEFDGHPALAPLLLYDGFEGFPGRKEFPFNDYQEF